MQFHTNVDTAAWRKLFAATSQWPQENRTQKHILMFALHELFASVVEGDIPTTSRILLGKTHVHVRCDDPVVEAQWDFLRSHFNCSGSDLLQTALGDLYHYLVSSEEE